MDSRQDIAFALVIVLAGVFVIAATWSTGSPIVNDTIGPRAFPVGIGILFIVGGAVLALQRVRNRNAEGGYIVESDGTTEDEPGLPASGTRAGIIIGLTFFYALLFRPLGFLITTPLYVVAALAVMNERRWVATSIWAVIYTIAAYVLFAVILKARIPTGPLAPLLNAY